MSPPFSLAGYAELLDALAAGGYRAAGFEDDDGSPGQVFLRHDIDKCLDAALRMAELEASRGVRAHYFFLLRTPLYSLLEPSARATVLAIAELGHWVGLHCDETRLRQARPELGDLDEAVEAEIGVLEAVLGRPVSRAMSFHNPAAAVVGREPATGRYASAYAPRFMMPHTKYLSDSNQRWREGDPRPVLAAGTHPRIQLLTHPVWWDGADRPALATLEGVFDRRVDALNTYMHYTNDVWREHGGQPTVAHHWTSSATHR